MLSFIRLHAFNNKTFSLETRSENIWQNLTHDLNCYQFNKSSQVWVGSVLGLISCSSSFQWENERRVSACSAASCDSDPFWLLVPVHILEDRFPLTSEPMVC